MVRAQILSGLEIHQQIQHSVDSEIRTISLRLQMQTDLQIKEGPAPKTPTTTAIRTPGEIRMQRLNQRDLQVHVHAELVSKSIPLLLFT